MRISDGTKVMVGGRGGFVKRAGWCLNHDDFAWRFGDGSIECLYCYRAEISNGECKWEPRQLLAPFSAGTPRQKTR